MRILIITDKTRADFANSISEPTNFDILNLGISGEVFQQLNAERISGLNYRILNSDRWSEEAQEKVRKFVPDFIYRFPREEFKPGVNLLQLLRMPDGFNLWWFMEMSEKGALRTPLIKRLYYWEIIKTAVSDQHYGEIRLDIEDQVLAQTLQKNCKQLAPLIRGPRIRAKSTYFWANWFLRTGKEIARVILRRVVLKLLGRIKPERLPNNSAVCFSFFPYFWVRSSRQGMIENFFRLDQFAYAVWLSLGPGALWRKRELLRSPDHLVLIEAYLNEGSFIKIIRDVFRYFIRLIKFRLQFKKHIKVIQDGFDITGIVKDELELSLVSLEVIRCLFLKEAVNQLVQKNHLGALLYRIEFQPHERAIELGVGNKCKTIAFQHQAIARNHLQYFFPKEELEGYYLNKGNPDNLPLPDKFIITGEYPYLILRSEGIPEGDLHLCGPLRYAGLIKYLKNPQTKTELRKKYSYPEDPTIFLIASPSAREEMLTFVNTLLKVLKELKSQDLFLFKSHPVFKHDAEIIRMIGEIYPALRYEFLADEIDLNEYLALADALLLTGTTVGIEAISLGTVPILFDVNSTFSLNPLLEIKDACFWPRNAEELKGALRSAKDEFRLKGVKAHWEEAIKKVFYDLSKDPLERFKGILLKEGVLTTLATEGKPDG